MKGHIHVLHFHALAYIHTHTCTQVYMYVYKDCTKGIGFALSVNKSLEGLKQFTFLKVHPAISGQEYQQGDQG